MQRDFQRWIPRTTGAGLLLATASLGLLTLLLIPLLDEDAILNVALFYLLFTLVLSALCGYRVGIFAAVLSDVLVNFFFVPPVHTLTVQEPSNVVALVVFLAVALIGGSMLSLLRRQVLLTEARRAETQTLLDLSQSVAHAVSPRDALERLCSAAARAVQARGCSILKEDFSGRWVVAASTGEVTLTQDDQSMASEAVHSGEIIRFGKAASSRTVAGPHGHLARTAVTFVPFRKETKVRGVLRLTGALTAPSLVEISRLLNAFGDEAALALERSRLFEEARRAEALARADEFKTALLSSVSHDLRSPLTAIKAAVGSLRDETVDWSEHDRAAFLETIESQTDRLTATVSGLLQMSRLEGGAVRPELERIDVGELLADAVHGTQGVTAEREVSVASEPGLAIRADYALILQALVNLIENAAKYSTAGGPIRLDAGHRGGRVTLRISDSGPGIPAEDLPHIFEKFYRGKGTTGATKGTGLGLSIVRAMVGICGGNVQVQTSSDGTVFTIDLPPGGPA